MRFRHALLLLFAVVLSAGLQPQAQVTTIVIPAGTPEDRAIQEITKETDAEKQAAQWKQFVEKFSASPAALAYGYAQLSQQALSTGNAAQALAYGDKALAAIPNNLDILMSQVNVAQQLKDNGKVVEYAVRGGVAFNGIGAQPRPEAMSDKDFASRIEQERSSAQPAYDYLESAALNAIASVQNPQQRMACVEQFEKGFPKSRFQEQVAQYAVLALQQMNDWGRLASYGEKALAANPDNLALLTLMAAALAEDPKGTYLTRAIDYAHKAIALAKADAPDADRTRKLSAGLAHSALGFALLKQEKNPPAISELKTAAGLLKEDPAAYSTVMYRLGFVYAKLKRYAEAREALNKAAAIEGPFQQPARDLLARIAAVSKKP